jgi:hypothetical protein
MVMVLIFVAWTLSRPILLGAGAARGCYLNVAGSIDIILRASSSRTLAPIQTAGLEREPEPSPQRLHA